MQEKNLKSLLAEILEKNRHWAQKGQVASYIPELGKADAGMIGVCICSMEGSAYSAGECQVKFTLQSISKVVSLMLALLDRGIEAVFSRVGMEPTGDPFNSIYKLETIEPSKPLNPMINAGAIAVTAQIKGGSVEERLARILGLVRVMAGNDRIFLNEDVYQSEKATGDRNRALGFFLRDVGIIEGDVEEILDLYFRQCAIEVTCQDLAMIGRFLASYGQLQRCREFPVTPEIARLVKTFMVTCGMYNASGEFAIAAGIPAKSGVSGGILAAVPHRLGIGVIGPALDEKGNSIAGTKILAALSRKLNLSIF